MRLRLDAATAGLVAEAETALISLNAQHSGSLAPLARLLLRTESIASSKVEGMQLGVRELARAEAKMESGIRVGATVVEVLANIDAMMLAVEHAAHSASVSPADAQSIHRRLLEQTPQHAIAGRLRSTQNWIGGNDYNPCGADFVPPPPEYVEPLMHDLCEFLNDDTVSPLLQAAVAHAQFETIHPFDDGNGRTGRALVHVALRRRGLTPHFLPPLSVVFAGDRSRYIAGLTGFRGADVSLWIEQFAAATLQATRVAHGYMTAVQALQAEWRERLLSAPDVPRADATAWLLIERLPAHPILSAAIAGASTGRAKARVYEAIAQLEKAGVLLPLTDGTRNRWWEVSGLLDLVARVEGGGLG
jgi:Fic family protein